MGEEATKDLFIKERDMWPGEELPVKGEYLAGILEICFQFVFTLQMAAKIYSSFPCVGAGWGSAIQG